MSFKSRINFGRHGAAIAMGAVMLAAGTAHALELDPAAVIYKLPDQIAWKGTGGNRSAVLVGDPEKPGLYSVINKWLAGNNFSRPHFHPNDRFITVLKGTWWVGTGNKFDPDATVPMTAGTFVTHFGKQVHWDGAKDEDAVLLIVGEGPATSTRVEEANFNPASPPIAAPRPPTWPNPCGWSRRIPRHCRLPAHRRSRQSAP
jgi:hypothetical protein